MYQYSPLPEELVTASNAVKEDNDCTVKAFALVFNTTYSKAHHHLAVYCNRLSRRGIVSRKVLPQSIKKTRHKVGPYSATNKITLKKFCERHPEGRFFVTVSGHAIAVINGVVYDHSDRPRRFVKWAMRVFLD